MPMIRVSGPVLQSADQLKLRLQLLTGRPSWRDLTRDAQFAVGLLAAADCTDEQLVAYANQLLESGESTDEPDTP